MLNIESTLRYNCNSRCRQSLLRWNVLHKIMVIAKFQKPFTLQIRKKWQKSGAAMHYSFLWNVRYDQSEIILMSHIVSNNWSGAWVELCPFSAEIVACIIAQLFEIFIQRRFRYFMKLFLCNENIEPLARVLH